MNNLIVGVFLVIVCLLGYFLAYKFSKLNNYKSAIGIILLCGLLLRLYTGSDFYLHEWDERYHALVAKHLTDHPFKPTLYENPVFPYSVERWVENHIWLEKGPISLWLSALSLKLFGFNEIALRIPSILLSTLAILLTFLIGKILFNPKVGLLAAFLHSINGLLIEVAGGRISSDMVETSFIFFVELGAFLSVYAIYSKKLYAYSLLIGLATGLSLLSKWSPGLIVIPLWLAGAYFSKNYSLKQLFFCALLITVVAVSILFLWISYILTAFPEEANFVIRKFLFAYSETLEGHNGPVYYYLNRFRMLFGELIYIPLILSLYFVIRKKLRWQLILLTVWWLVPMIIFSTGATKRQTYSLIYAPAIFIIISYSWFYLKFIRQKIKLRWVINTALILLLALPVGFCIERVKPFDIRKRNPDWAVHFRNLKNKIPAGKNVVIFNLYRSIEVMFYTDCTAYERLPDLKTIKELQDKGYVIIINDNGKVPSEYFNAGITIIPV